jgi:maleate isomerase
MPSREYARHALIGIAPPQSNPVVEAEYSALMPDGVGLLTTRLTGTAEDPKARFHQFLENFDQSLAAYGKAQPDAVGFACTATAYLFGSDEPDILSATSARLGIPVLSSAIAIQRALDRLGVRRIALFSPYPDWLTKASRAYWESVGYDIVSLGTMPDDTTDTVNIYGLTSTGFLAAAAALETEQADAILVTGTGMPVLPAIEPLFRRTGMPILCSNLCLAWALLDELDIAGLAPPANPWETLIGGWTPRLTRL